MRVSTRAALVVAVVAASALLTGCAGDPTTAAEVDGRVITRAEVEAAQEDYTAFSGGAAAEDILVRLVVAQLVIDRAEAEGVGVSAEQARANLEAAAEQAELGDRDFADSTVEIERMSTAVVNLQGLEDAEQVFTELSEDLTELDVTVNPRYGTYDVEAATLSPTSYPWIVGAEAATEPVPTE